MITTIPDAVTKATHTIKVLKERNAQLLSAFQLTAALLQQQITENKNLKDELDVAQKELEDIHVRPLW